MFCAFQTNLGFGTVYIGEWKGTKVAVKKLKGLDNS